jgi:hypothetical protein
MMIVPFFVAFFVARPHRPVAQTLNLGSAPGPESNGSRPPWRRENWIKFSIWFFVLGIIWPLVSAAASNLDRSRVDPQDLVRQAVGAKPLDDSLSNEDKQFVEVVRGVFADMKAVKEASDKQAAALQGDLSILYSSESFASKDAMQRCLDAVTKVWTTDSRASTAFERLPESIKARLDQTSFSESDKQEFINGIHAGMTKSGIGAATKQMFSTEASWVDATTGLYAYALQHAPQIRAGKSGIRIADAATAQEFNTRLDRAVDLRNQLAAAYTHLESVRAAGLKEAGLTPADLGMAK